MNYSQQGKKAFQTKSLKEIYPEVQQRKKYLQKRLSDCRLQKPILVRIQPHVKTTLPHIFTTQIMDHKTKICELCSQLHKKILKLGPNHSLFLFCNKSLVTLNQQVDELLQKNGEEDGILYLLYSDNNPF